MSAVAHIIGVGCVCFFLYLPLSNLLAHLGVSLGVLRLLAWLFITLCVLVGIWIMSQRSGTAAVLLAVSLAMFVGPVIGLSYFTYSGFLKGDGEMDRAARAGKVSAALPNVYWVILDAYPRADILHDHFGVDNSEFIMALRNREFTVSDRSMANFASTKLSLSTTASMEYYLPDNGQLHPTMWTARLQGFNAVVEKFQSLGYRYVHAEPGGSNLKTRCGGMEHKCIRAEPVGSIGINEAEANLLRLTPLFPVIRRMAPGFLSFDFTSVADLSAQLEYSGSTPTFLFAHLLTPHPPQRFDKDCGRNVPVSFDLDGEDYSKVVDAFINDLRCLNPLIIGLIDEILTRDLSDPYIIIQSDHGFRGVLPETGVREMDVAPHLVAFANLSAIKLPQTCAQSIKDGFSLINTFRIVLACIEDKEPRLLPNRYFSTSKGRLKEVHLE